MSKTPSQKYWAKKKALGKKAMALWKELVLKSNPHCEGMGINCTGKSTVGHHFVYQSMSNHLRYDVRNGIGLCFNCHHAIHRTGKTGIIHMHIIQGRSEEWKKYINDNEQVRVSTTLQWYKEQILILESLTKK